MARTTTTKKAATQPRTDGPAYRSTAAWQAAHGTAKGVAKGAPQYAAALQVATHLAWRGPAGAVAWHKGTNPTMVANAAAMGVEPGQPVHEAMAAVLDSMGQAATTQPQRDAHAALLAATMA